MGWDYVYEEEHFDSNGYCCVGIISNGKNYLFYTVACEKPKSMEICKIYNSISFDLESMVCKFKWTSDNDELLFNCLNSVEDEDIFTDDSPLLRLQFND